MNRLREITSSDELVFGKIIEPETGEPLVPAIAVNGAGLAFEGLAAIRMVGFANEEAVDVTFEKRLATFYSRSQGGLWTKGETSGDILSLRAAYADCDTDTLLLDVDPTGPTCHTGARSCFERPGGGSGTAYAEVETEEEIPIDFFGYIASLATIAGRKALLEAGEAPETYTQKLLASQNERVKKLGSETAEFIREGSLPDFDEEQYVNEGADLVYALEVDFAARGIPFAKVFNELARRNRES